MAVTQLKDGRWVVYYRDKYTGRMKKEYHGRGTSAKNKAFKRNSDLGYSPPKKKKSKKVYGIARSNRIIDLITRKVGKQKIQFEVKTEAGNIDVLTPTEIIEIKNLGDWKHALGQVLSYGFCVPDKKLRIYLYGEIDIEYYNFICNVCKQYRVEVSFYGEISVHSKPTLSAVESLPRSDDAAFLIRAGNIS